MKTLIDISPERTGTAFRLREIYPKIKDATVIRGMHLVQYHPIYPMYPEFATPYEKLDLLKKHYSGAFVFYVDRKKETWIKSMYNHWVRQGGTLRFTDWHNNVMDKRVFDTDELIKYARRVFGDNFYLLGFEEFVLHPTVEFNKLLSYFCLNTIVVCNKKHNSSFNIRQTNLCRILNKVYNRCGRVSSWVDLLRKS